MFVVKFDSQSSIEYFLNHPHKAQRKDFAFVLMVKTEHKSTQSKDH